jgi:hypothetical protein
LKNLGFGEGIEFAIGLCDTKSFPADERFGLTNQMRLLYLPISPRAVPRMSRRLCAFCRNRDRFRLWYRKPSAETRRHQSTQFDACAAAEELSKMLAPAPLSSPVSRK